MNGDMLGTLLPIIAMFAIMWFLLIRPAQKRQKQTKQMQESLKRGDKVITIGGLHGVIDAVDDTSVFLKVADGTTLQFDRQAVGACSRSILIIGQVQEAVPQLLTVKPPLFRLSIFLFGKRHPFLKRRDTL